MKNLTAAMMLQIHDVNFERLKNNKHLRQWKKQMKEVKRNDQACPAINAHQ